MSTPVPQDPGESPALAGTEGEALAASAARSREADRELASALRRTRPGGRVATTEYLAELGSRRALTAADERELAAAARAGDADARARLVEASMPLIASIARVYRDSPQVDRVELLQE